MSMDQTEFENLIKTLENASIINLHYKKINTAQAQKLANVLIYNVTVKNLDLSSNQIGDKGGIALAKAIENNNTLQTLDLSDNSIGPKGIIALAKALENNNTLERLYLRSNNIGTKEVLVLAESLKTNKKLQTLALCDNEIGAKGTIAFVKALNANKSVCQLFLSRNKIGSKGAVAVMNEMMLNKNVHTLGLGDNKIGDDGAIALAKIIETNTTIQAIHLSSNQIGNKGATAIVKSFDANKVVHTLDLAGNNFGPKDFITFVEALESNKTIRTLNLDNNRIVYEGAASLAKMLMTNMNIQSLNLRRNEIGDYGAAALAKTLKNNTSLLQLDISCNQIGDTGLAAFAEALKINKTVQILDFSYNQIKDSGVVAIAKALEINNTIIKLDLRGNEIRNAGVTVLAKALQANKALQMLELSNNIIGYDSVGAIALREIKQTLDRNNKIAMQSLEKPINKPINKDSDSILILSLDSGDSDTNFENIVYTTTSTPKLERKELREESVSVSQDTVQTAFTSPSFPKSPIVQQPTEQFASKDLKKNTINSNSNTNSSNSVHTRSLSVGSNSNSSESEYEHGWRWEHGDGVEKDLKNAFGWYTIAAKKGHMLAQFELGKKYYEGIAVKQNYTESTKWYLAAALQGHAASQYKVGMACQYGFGIEKDINEACHWYQISAEQKYQEAEEKIKELTEEGQFPIKDVSEATSSSAASQKSLSKTDSIASSQNRPPVPPRPSNISKHLRSATVSDSKYFSESNQQEKNKKQQAAASKTNLSEPKESKYDDFTFEQEPSGLARNDTNPLQNSFNELLIKAQNGDAQAQLKVAHSYLNGGGITNDRNLAAKWYRKAATNNNALIEFKAEAQFQFGWMIENGQGVERNEKDACDWLTLAAENGHVKAQFELGNKYRWGGHSVERDDIQSAFWYLAAAEQNHERAMYEYAMCCQSGKGVKKDEQQYKVWLVKAAECNEHIAINECICIFGNSDEHRDKYVKWLDKAVEYGNRKAFKFFIYRFLYGKDGLKDNNKASNTILKFASLYERGYFWCGLIYENGLGVTQDLRAAAQYYYKAIIEEANTSITIACAILSLKRVGFQLTEPKTELEKYLIRAKNGDVDALIELGDKNINQKEGLFLNTLKYMDRNNFCSSAYLWYQLAADQGSAKAVWSLGVLVEQTSKDKDMAVEFFQQAIALDYTSARNNLKKLGNIEYDENYNAIVRKAYKNDLASQFELSKLKYNANLNLVRNYWCLKAADQGYVDAQYEMGRRFATDIAIWEDHCPVFYDSCYLNSYNYYRQAAEQGHTEAQLKCGEICETGDPAINKDLEQAIQWYLLAANQGNLKSLLHCARFYENTESMKDITLAKELYKIAIALGAENIDEHLTRLNISGLPNTVNLVLRKAYLEKDAKAQLQLATWYDTGNHFNKNHKFACMWYLKAAQQGLVDAQNKLAYYYEHGLGIEQDVKLAIEWYRKAANQGNNNATQSLKRLGHETKVVQESTSNFLANQSSVVNKSTVNNGSTQDLADAGDRDAQFELGLKYDKGLGVAQSSAQAAKWYLLAAKQKHVLAEFHYAKACAEGKGVAKSIKAAFGWFKLAATHGDADAQFEIGAMYEHGQGTEKDLIKAQEWYQQSANQKNVHAINAVTRLKASVHNSNSPANSLAPTKSMVPKSSFVVQERKSNVDITTAANLKSKEVASEIIEKIITAISNNLNAFDGIKPGFRPSLVVGSKGQFIIEFGQAVYYGWESEEQVAFNLLEELKQSVTPFVNMPTGLLAGKLIFLGQDVLTFANFFQIDETEIEHLFASLNLNFSSIKMPADLKSTIEWRQALAQTKDEIERRLQDVLQSVTTLTEDSNKSLLEEVTENIKKLLENDKSSKPKDLKTTEDDLQMLTNIQEQMKDLENRAVQDNEARSQLAALKQEIGPLLEEFSERQEVLSQQQYILQEPRLKEFYNQFQRKLNQLLVAYMSISSGEVERQKDTTSKALTFLGELLPFKLGSILIEPLNVIYNRKKNKKIASFVSNDAFISTTSSDIMVEDVARKLTLRYQDQIKKTTLPGEENFSDKMVIKVGPKGGAQTMAECAVVKIVDFLHGGKLVQEKPLDEQLLDCIFLNVKSHGLIPLLTKQKIQTVDNKAWNEEVFRMAGIKIIKTTENNNDNNQQTLWYVGRDKNQYCSKANLYGYRWGTEDEVVKLQLVSTKAPDNAQFIAHNTHSAGTTKFIAQVKNDTKMIREENEFHNVTIRLELESLKKELAKMKMEKNSKGASPATPDNSKVIDHTDQKPFTRAFDLNKAPNLPKTPPPKVPTANASTSATAGRLSIPVRRPAPPPPG